MARLDYPAELEPLRFGFSFEVVTHTRDGDDAGALSPRSVQGSLRQMMDNANAIQGSQRSLFRLTEDDGGFDDANEIDGSTQEGYEDRPLVEISGENLIIGANGITARADDCVVHALVVRGFRNSGIVLAADDNVVTASYAGLDASGLLESRNTVAGVRVESGRRNRIGGPDEGDGNVLSGNGQYGVLVSRQATDTIIRGNFIGVAVDGATVVGNGVDGVRVDGAARTIVGGAEDGQGNVVGGNLRDGVHVRGNTSVGTVVAEGKELRELDGRTYVLERPLRADFAFIRARRGDAFGNLRFWRTARNFSPIMATAAQTTIAEVDELVAIGGLDPDDVHVSGIFVQRVLEVTDHEDPFEYRTVRERV